MFLLLTYSAHIVTWLTTQPTHEVLVLIFSSAIIYTLLLDFSVPVSKTCMLQRPCISFPSPMGYQNHWYMTILQIHRSCMGNMANIISTNQMYTIMETGEFSNFIKRIY